MGAALLLEVAIPAPASATGLSWTPRSTRRASAAAAVAHALPLRGLTARYRRRRAARLDEELVALRDSARDYRLIAAALGPGSRAPRGRDEEERLLGIGGVGNGRRALWVCALSARSVRARWRCSGSRTTASA